MTTHDSKMLASNPYWATFGVVYIGQQERLNYFFALDMFKDLATGRIFLRRPTESVDDMAKRIKRGGA